MDGGSDELATLRAELAREREKVHALRDIGAALGSTLDLDDLLELVLQRISVAVDADRATLYLLDEETGQLVSKVAQGAHEIRLSVGEGLAGWVARTGETINIRDAYADVRFDGEWDRRTGYRTRSTLCVPMKNHLGRTIGVVQVLNRRVGPFTTEDEGILIALASQAAISIENSKLFLSVVGKNMELLDAKDQLERKIRELDVLFEIAQVAAGAVDLDELLSGVLARSIRALDAEAGSVLLAEEKGNELIFRARTGPVQRLKIASNHGLPGWVAKNREPQLVHDASRDPRVSAEIAHQVGYTPHSILCVPLDWKAGAGAIEVFDKAGGQPFTEEDVKLASVIAGHVSTAIGLARSRAVREREERLSTIGQLLSSVLHDLKTPLTVVSGYVQLLVGEEDKQARRAYADAVLRQVRTLNAMTREILAFARGDRTVLIRRVYVTKVFDEIREQLARDLTDRGVRIVLDLKYRGAAHLDQQKLERALHNLARNSADAMGDRGGTITLSVERREDDGALIVKVTDDGPGIPVEVRDRLFESFATHGKSGGTGLGLAIVRKVVEDHEGSVLVESAPGKTEFTIILPQPPREPSTDRESSIPGEPTNKSGATGAMISASPDKNR